MSSQDGLGPLQTVDRALFILSLFTPARPEVTVAQAAQALEVSRSIASRLFAALEARQFVIQDQATGRFRLGVSTLDLGALFLQTHPLVTAATPYLEQLGREDFLMARANLFILDDGEALRLASYPARPLTRIRVPVHATASGKVLLAGLPDAEVDRLIAERGLAPRTFHTLTDAAALWDQLRQVRARGYAFDAEESHLGGFCYAAPLQDIEGRTAGAISISLNPVGPPSAELVGRLIQHVTEASRRISESLGPGPLRQAMPAPRGRLVAAGVDAEHGPR